MNSMNAIEAHKSAPATVTTTNRRLEHFLYGIGIYHIKSFKQWDCMTAWVYEATPQFKQAVKRYKELYQAYRGTDVIRFGGDDR